MGVVEFRNTGLEGPARGVAERQRRHSPPEADQRGSKGKRVNAPRVSVVGQNGTRPQKWSPPDRFSIVSCKP